MTLGVVTTSFPRHRGDFAGSFVEDAVGAAARAGLRVEVLAAGQAGRLQDVLETRDDLGGQVRVRRIAAPARTGGPPLFYGPGAPEALEQGGAAVWLDALGFWAGLCDAIRREAPAWTRVVAHWLVPCGLAARTCAARLPLTIYAHSGDVALLERFRAGRLIARHLAGSAGSPAPDIIFASNNLRERFARLVGRPMGRVDSIEERIALRGRGWSALGGAGVPSPGREGSRGRLGIGGRTVLSVGRLVPIKGFDVLIRAAAVAAAAAGEARATVQPGSALATTLVILGDGPERSRLAALARRLDVDLRLPGFVSREEVGRWMASADLYVQPSRQLASGRTEGLPIATLEALACGVPVLASATAGLAELPYGPPRLRLVAPDDPAALAACLEG